jgi:hypothetical protein
MGLLIAKILKRVMELALLEDKLMSRVLVVLRRGFRLLIEIMGRRYRRRGRLENWLLDRLIHILYVCIFDGGRQ